VLQNSPLGDGGFNSPLGDGGRGILHVIKIGGNIIDDEEKLNYFLKQFAAIQSPLQGMGAKILVHGGGKLATKLAGDLNIPQQVIEGRRVTNADTLKVVTMVYAGYINKNIVAQLQANGCNAIGLSGVDGNIITAHKRFSNNSPLGDGGTNSPSGDGIRNIDYGYAGDIDSINTDLLQLLLEQNMAIVLAPITHNNEGQLLNTNADTIAQEIAKAFCKVYDAHLIYTFEKAGVLSNVEDETSVLKELTYKEYKELQGKQKIFAGMIPKLDNAFAALQTGVKKVIIGKAENLSDLINGNSGTTIIYE
jgi:acetylglutamate kinase